MGSIGMIFKAEPDMDALPADWVPKSLGPRAIVQRVIVRHLQIAASSTPVVSLSMEVEDENGMDPRVISVAGVWGDAEMVTIHAICVALGARFHDAEMSGFIDE
jgi:hypothetical protein